jgi:hypothetical protein
MRKRNGRKAYILLSDCVAFCDPTSVVRHRVWERADTSVYSILFAYRVSL